MSAYRRRIYHRVQLAAHLLQKLADRILLDATGATAAQIAVLSVLAESGDSSQKDIAAALGVSESAVTLMSKRLLDMGLLHRRPNPNDSRAWLLSLSAAGADRVVRAAKAFAHVNALIDAELDDARLGQIVAGLDAITAAIGAEIARSDQEKA